MIAHPAILALLLSSVLISGLTLYASFFGVRVLAGWNIASGSDRQLALERRTYLVSTILSYVLAFQTASIFLFIYTADSLHSRFVGAMCAAGVLYVNGYGYPALLLKIVNFLLAGIWLIVNYADNRAHDYPLIRKKYALLLLITPFILAELVLLANFFLRLHPDVITSCCGSLFSLDSESVLADISGLPHLPAAVLLYGGTAATVGAGVYFLRTGRGGLVFSCLSGATFAVMLLALISFVSLYFYELPTHHCPFCILQGEYGYIGYPLYGAMLGGAVCGLGVGALAPFRKVRSLALVLPGIQRRLAAAAVLLYLLFIAIVLFRIASSDFTLLGY